MQMSTPRLQIVHPLVDLVRVDVKQMTRAQPILHSHTVSNSSVTDDMRRRQHLITYHAHPHLPVMATPDRLTADHFRTSTRKANSTTSSPLSAISTDESHYDSLYSYYSAERPDSGHSSSSSRFGSPFTRCSVSPAYSDFTSADSPLDLSKPKDLSTTSSHKGSRKDAASSKSSQLEHLLSKSRRKRRAVSPEEGLGEEQEDEKPLNLSSKQPRQEVCASHVLPAIVDMCDAVDNPVDLVELAKGCEHQVCAKISAYIKQVIHKIFSMDMFLTICKNDQLSLIISCWHRLLLWMCACDKFTCQVTSKSTQTPSTHNASPCKESAMNQPSMAFVKSMATFISKFSQLKVDDEEFNLLFAITLFHGGQEAMYDRLKIDQYKKQLMRQLQFYVLHKPGGGPKRYTDLLLYLPLVYGINGHMVAKLFCSQLAVSQGTGVDMKLILKETINRYTQCTS